MLCAYSQAIKNAWWLLNFYQAFLGELDFIGFSSCCQEKPSDALANVIGLLYMNSYTVSLHVFFVCPMLEAMNFF